MTHVFAAGPKDDLIGFFETIGPFLFYVTVLFLVFAGTALFLGVFLPFVTGDTLLFAAGLVVAASDNLNIVVLAVGVGVAAFLGDQVGFIIGRQAGSKYLEKPRGKRVTGAIYAAERFYSRYGWWSIVVARFVPWGRVFIPVVAGIGRMNYAKFLTSNLFGALAWGVGLTLVGYFSASIPGVKNVAYAIAAIVITISIIAGVRVWKEERAARESQEDSVAAALITSEMLATSTSPGTRSVAGEETPNGMEEESLMKISPRKVFRAFALAEMVTWAALITALILRATEVTNLVSVAGGIHGFIFLCYSTVTVFVWVNQKWRFSIGITGLLLAIVPFATVPFELWADRRQLLDGPWRLTPGGDAPRGFIEHVMAWVLRHLILSIVLLVVLISAVFIVLLWLGPPVPHSA